MSDKKEKLLSDLANYLDCEYEGDPEFVIVKLASLKNAKKNHVTFYTDDRFKNSLDQTEAGCVLLHKSNRDKFTGNKLLSLNPYLDYARLSKLFSQNNTSPAIHPSASIAENVILGENINIGANVVIKSGCSIGSNTQIEANTVIDIDVKVGEGTIIYSNTSIYHGASIGDYCTIHSGVVIGADGFGFARSSAGWEKIYQLGSVEIGNNVELGAGTTIDRGALDNTKIGNGVKIDNQVQVAHNVIIGDNTAIAAHTAIAGSAVIGERCTIAGCVGIVGHIEIADDVHITGMTMVSKSIKTSGSYSSGIPMSETKKWRKNAARFNQLDEIARKIK
jgi:UDP-3-O-[3-hydroxymyristoyl] glucosamine N-acyltransferase